MRYVEKQIVLQVLDHLWREHLVVLDHLRQVIGWRGLAQRDPLNEYKSEAFDLFGGLIAKLREIVTAQLMRVEVAFEQPSINNSLPPMFATHADPLTGDDDMAVADINARLAAGDFSNGGGHHDHGGRGGTRARIAQSRRIRRAGARSAGTKPARAAPDASTSTATALWSSAVTRRLRPGCGKSRPVTVATSPDPDSRLVSAMFRWWRVAIAMQIASPRPVPSMSGGAARKNRSKMRGSASCLMPQPVSAISTVDAVSCGP